MKVTPYSPGCGALIEDVQLADVSADTLTSLRKAFSDYGLLFFREQDLSAEQHLAFANRFGEIVVNKFFPAVSDFPEIAEVRKEKHQVTNIGGGWHTDHSYDQVPAMGSILVARELPDSGGATCFANLSAAYDALTPELKESIEGLRALHSNKHLYGKGGYYRETDLASQLGGVDSVGDAIHPVVIVHPESGRKVLSVNPGHTVGLEGWGREESKAFLDALYEHVAKPQFTCEFDWQPGSVTLWDNRSTWHFANNDYQGQSRLMHRITLAGSPLN